MKETRILAVDLGAKRIGVALSDPLGLTAQPRPRIDCVGPRKDVRAIVALAEASDATEIVVGLPLQLDGTRGEAAENALAFAERLREAVGVEVPVTMWDERLTTAQAERVMIEGGARRSRRREKIDSLAAVLILQNVLDARSGPAS